ncbi:MAG: SRPBCC family protein [Ilumatobacteraceae bacterium]|nr:SRPBCC family protein [Ilumatobacteraceae bacterium]
MARYVTTVRTEQTPAEVFAYMADLRNFAQWDPRVKKVVQVKGAAGGVDAQFDVAVSGTTLRYITTEYEPDTNLLVVAKSRALKSTDRITVVADGATTLVTYDALLELNGLLGLADPLLRLAFGRIGDRAAAGLRRVLSGEDVPA